MDTNPHLPPLPEAVRRQRDIADQLMNGTGTPPDQTAGGDPPADPAASPGDAGNPPEGSVPPSQPPANEPSGTQADEGWKHKYDVLRGKYDNEVPRLAQENRAMAERLGQLEALLAAMQAAAPVATPVATQPVEDGITDEERAEYGDDLIKLIEKKARALISQEVAPLRQQVQQVGQSVRVTTTATAQNGVLTALDNWNKNWRTQNNDAGFLSWLQELDPLSGQPRKHLLDSAFQGGAAQRVIAIFSAYRQEHGRRGASPQPGPTAQPTLETFAAPGRPASQSTAPAQGRVYTRADIARHFAEKTKGLWRGREQEAARIEADFIRAGVEGRVVG